MSKRFSILITLMLVMISSSMSAQRSDWSYKKKFGTQKNCIYISWGYNREIYTKSNITFWGPTYNFVLKDAKAHDRPSGEFRTYINPSTISVPQFNVRVGWYYKWRWDWSIGYDHMKYVMQKTQKLLINGVIEGTSGSLNGVYTDEDGYQLLDQTELHYENTNGLNYVSVQLNNTAPIYKTKDLNFAFQRRLGVGAGPVIVQTDFAWDGVRYNSPFKFGGYGFSLHAGLRWDFYKHFFLATQGDAGFIHLPKNSTIYKQGHYAKHAFGYLQWQLLGGVLLYARTKNKCDSCPDWD